MPAGDAPSGAAAPGEPDVTIGVVGKALGLRGEVYVRPDADLPGDVFVAGMSVRVLPPAPGGPADLALDEDERAAPRPERLRIASTRLHAGRRIVRFEGVDSREAAEELRHLELAVPRTQVSLDEDAFWSGDLLGREVVDETGAVVGVLEAVADGPAHDYLVVARPDGGELLIPAVADLVDVSADVIVVQAIPGLLDPEG